MAAALVVGCTFKEDTVGKVYGWFPEYVNNNSEKASIVFRAVALILGFINSDDYLYQSGRNPEEVRRRIDTLPISG